VLGRKEIYGIYYLKCSMFPSFGGEGNAKGASPTDYFVEIVSLDLGFDQGNSLPGP